MHKIIDLPDAAEDDAASEATRPSPAPWPSYAADEIDAVVEVMRSGRVNQWTGDKVVAFERAYDAYLGTGRSIALANGSLALELALLAFRIGPGDEVIVTPRSFVASASCVRLVGATPVFADVDPNSGNLTCESVAAAITPRTKAIIPVHLAGWPVDMPGMMALARANDLLVIEDCAQAHGAFINGKPVGAFGDAAAFSFCQDKIITTGGEGGLVSFQDDAAYRWAWSFKDHGKNRDKMGTPGGSGFRFIHDMVGTNWRMLEMSAVIGLAQLAKLPNWREARAANAAIWMRHLGAIDGIRIPTCPAGSVNAFYKLYAYVDGPAERANCIRDAVLAHPDAGRLRIFSGSCPELYREGAMTDLGVAPLPVAHDLGLRSLLVEVHPTLDPVELDARAARVAALITAAMANA